MIEAVRSVPAACSNTKQKLLPYRALFAVAMARGIVGVPTPAPG
jgi:hypothetical protein